MAASKTKSAVNSVALLLFILLLIVLFATKTKAQNVGIGTNTPQATLDVKGNHRMGGLNKYLSFDSVTGKIVWNNSNLFVASSQYLMQHSASGEGLYYGNSQLEYRYQDGTPRFFTNWNTGNGYFYGNLGIGTINPLARLHVMDSSVVFSAAGGAPSPVESNPPISGAGRRMMWYSEQGAFRAGHVVGTEWDKDSIGVYSVATGLGTIASGDGATAMGIETKARTTAATAIGFKTIANGQYSTSMGQSTTANGFSSVSMGLRTVANANGSVSMGHWNDNADNPHPVMTDSLDRMFQIGNGTNIQRSNAMTVLRNGSVGIGLTGPTATLDVARGNAGGGAAQFRGTDNISHFNFGTDEDTYIRSGKNNRSVILNDITGGKVGIGLNVPTATLDIAKTTLGGTARLRGTNYSSFFNFGTTEDTYIRAGKDNGFLILNDIPGGKVGIGTNNPGFQLSFADELGDKISLWGNSGNHYGFGINSSRLLIHTAASSDDIAFGYGSFGSFTEKFRMKGTGAFEVNSSAGQPQQILKSNGNTSPTWNTLGSIFQTYKSGAAPQQSPPMSSLFTSYDFPNFSHTVSIIQKSRLIISGMFDLDYSCSGCLDFRIVIECDILNSSNQVIDFIQLKGSAGGNSSGSVTLSGYMADITTAGIYTVRFTALWIQGAPTGGLVTAKFSSVMVLPID